LLNSAKTFVIGKLSLIITHSLFFICCSFSLFSKTVINNYGAAAASAAGFGNANSPANGSANSHRGHFPPANSPGPTIELYNSSQDSVPSYVQAASPQPASAFPSIAVSRV
jgi:hypothetical protein